MNEREAAIQFRLSKAKRLLQEVPLLQEHGLYGTLVSRLYYIMLASMQQELCYLQKILFQKHTGESQTSCTNIL